MIKNKNVRWQNGLYALEMHIIAKLIELKSEFVIIFCFPEKKAEYISIDQYCHQKVNQQKCLLQK